MTVYTLYLTDSKLLLSGNPQICQSSIWEDEDDIALMEDYASGLKNLEDFLSKITLSEAQPLIKDALEFLNKPENRNQYFVLECGKLFCMIDALFAEQNQELLEEIKNLQPEIEEALESLASENQPGQAGFSAKAFGRGSGLHKQEHDSLRSVYALGLGNWSNILYFDFSEEK